MEEVVKMTTKELDRYSILLKVQEKQLTQKNASDLLGIKERQIRNLLTKMSKEGVKGIISRHRGKPSNHKKSNEFKQLVISLLKEQYENFGPTLVKEKLQERHGLKISVETLRQWMIEESLWIPRKTKKKLHLPRQRRECFGEMIQADGSHHHWFGENEPTVNATVFIDDATSLLTSLVFSSGETLNSYFDAMEQHLKKYGRPRAIYTDRFAIFQSPTKKNMTQMQIALQKLDIKLILANSPQAKGRVERANRTLQDRLVKELKIRGIKTIDEANTYAKEFIEEYNKKFSKRPMRDFNPHRSLEGYDLERILCHYERRTLLSDCTFQYNNKIFKIQEILGVSVAVK